MANIDLRKNVRIHEALSEVLSELNLKELDYETMFFLFAKISKSHKDEMVYNLDIKELEQLTGEQTNLFRYIDSVKRLRKITIEIETDEYVLIDGILSSAKFIKGKSTMQVKISSDMKPFLLDLVKNYTEHQLYSIMRLKSKHAKKLYLFFNNLRPKSGCIRTVLDMQTIEEFKIKTGYKDPETGEETYKTWHDFNKRVLEVAKEEINALSNIKIAYNTKKFGREVYWIEWHIENKDNRELIQLEQFNTHQITSSDKDFKENLQEISDFAKLTKVYGLNEKQAEIALKRISRELLNEILTIIDNQVKKKKDKGETITNMGGYSVKVFFDKGVDFAKHK
jgi:plasmid replication initiation protein